jgi:hypothetical protein
VTPRLCSCWLANDGAGHAQTGSTTAQAADSALKKYLIKSRDQSHYVLHVTTPVILRGRHRCFRVALSQMLSVYSAKRDNPCDNTGAISVESEDVYGNKRQWTGNKRR